MTGTSTATRSSPPRVFENYVLTRLVDPGAGLTDVPHAFFSQVTGPGPLTKDDAFSGAGAGGTDDATSNVLPLGFDFEMDGITYDRWCADSNGWMALVDPTTGAFSSGEVFSSTTFINEGVRPTFTSQAVLLAPWFDDLRNVLRDPAHLMSAPFSYSSTKVGRITQGLEPPPIFLNSTSYGISYYNDDRSTKGRRLVVRWASISNYTMPSSVIRFETVLYENGTIEYRYTPRSTITRATIAYEGATIGVFMPNGTNRFRDFSAGLGYRVDARREYVYGGYVYDPTYIDTAPLGNEDFGFSSPYTALLTPFSHWPGLRGSGCTMTFSPPVSRRRVLPRAHRRVIDSQQTYPSVARTGDTRRGSAPQAYDDRLSPAYASPGTGSAVIVNYPSTLPRFFGGDGVGTLERQDLFAGDFLVTGSVVKSAIDQYAIERPTTVVEPYNETARYEQRPNAVEGSFFVSGTTSEHVSAGFDQSLRSKTHVRFTLPVDTTVAMPGGSSSIYYYNAIRRAWTAPANSTYVMDNAATTPPSPNPYAGGDTAAPLVDATAGRIVEDARGFGPFGNVLSSGSHVPAGANDQTDASIGSQYAPVTVAAVVGKEYVKSVRNGALYGATADETFALPINAPFLIEKAVFELPLQAGSGWFDDLTQCFVPLVNSRSFDVGGPALTVALFRQVRLGSGPAAPTVRDLVMTGTITHVYDNTASVRLTNFPPTNTTYQVRPVGFLAYGGPPGAVVDDHGTSTFTGSVEVLSTALCTAGIDLIYRQSFTLSSASNAAAVAGLLTQSAVLPLSSTSTSPARTVTVGYVSPLGRGGTGFQQAGRCVLGNEYVTWQGLVDQTATKARNPFFVDSLSAQQLGALGAVGFSATASAVVPLRSYMPAPYLAMPDDRFVMTVSKTRPVVYGGATTFSGSAHDIALRAGNVNVTLYGSQIVAGKEHHDTLNQYLGSNVVHEILGAEPVIDQFEVSYRNEYSGSASDDVMLGTLGTQTVLSYSSGVPVRYVTVERVRDRRLSKLNARSAPQLGVSSAEIAITPSKSFRSEPWWETAGDVRTSQFIDSTERFWDSMLPSIKDCFAADGCGIFITQFGAFGSSYKIDTGVSGSLTFNPHSTRIGWIWMDYGIPTLLAAGYNKLINLNWNKSFPFEPRYRGASRQVNIERSLIATYIYGNSPPVQQISPTPVNGFAFGTVGLGTSFHNDGVSVTPISNTVCWDWVVDTNLSGQNVFGYYVTGSTNADDMSRALFGFGDRNTHFVYNNVGAMALLGSNHVVETRDVEGPHPDGVSSFFDNNFFRVSPRIRGWKYGVYSGVPTNTKAYWRRGRFGQLRDMLEQRLYSKFHQTVDRRIVGANMRQSTHAAVVTVTFIDPSTGRMTSPDNTLSSNLDHECTSSLPYFDGLSLNRSSSH